MIKIGFTRYFLRLVAILWLREIGFAGAILIAVRYGPFAVMAVIAGLLGFFYWKNETRNHGQHEIFDDKKPNSRQALERYLTLPGVKDKIVENPAD